MDSSSISPTKALNFLTPSSTTHSLTKPNPKPNLVNFKISQQRNPSNLTLTRCSTKPDTNSIKDQTSSFPQDPQRPTPPNPTTTDPPRSSSSAGLVFDSGPGSSWDSSEVGSPVVKRFLSDEAERWYMWYHGNSNSQNPPSDSVGLAISSNGIHWERSTEPAMKPTTDWWAFDTLGVRPSEIVIMSSSKVRASSVVYWMYYTGESAARSSLPGLAISQDGQHWARIEGDHHSGALMDVGSEKDWDSRSIASPHVVFHSNGDLRMYYHSFDNQNGEFCIGVARSRDGIRWVKLGKVIGKGQDGNFDAGGVRNPCVVRGGDGKYLMAYEGEGGVGLAESGDGLGGWARVQSGPVLWASEAQWDCVGVGSPCLVRMEGEEDEWRLYYRGVGKEGRAGIGMAVSLGSDVTKFTRWTGFLV